MSDSSRPLTTMPVFPSGHRCASAVQPTASPHVRLSRPRLRTWLAALMLLSALRAFASGHHAVASAHQSGPVRLSHAAVHVASHSASHAASPPAHKAQASAHLRGAAHATASANAPFRRNASARRNRATQPETRAGHHKTAQQSHNESSRSSLVEITAESHCHSHPGPPSGVETAANNSTQDRVHAWYQARNSRLAIATDAGQIRPENASPDLSTAPHKATAQDFDQAAAAQRRTIHSVSEQNERQTTAADDNADAQTHIPSTAPTEREPAPFQHGDIPATDGTSPVSRTRRDPAPLTRETPAAAAHMRLPAISASGARPQPSTALAIAIPSAENASAILKPAGKTPLHANPHPGDPASAGTKPSANSTNASLYRADMNGTSSLAGSNAADRGNTAAAPDKTFAKIPAGIPVTVAADSSPTAIRALHAEMTASPTPRFNLPAPPVSAAKKAAPAAAAVQDNARRPKLDPTVAQGMTEETFDGDAETPVTAKSAVALATAASSESPASLKARAAAAEDDPTSAVSRAANPVNLFDRQGHLVLIPAMKGSHEILVHQNQMAVTDGLDRIQDDAELAGMRRAKLLVALPDEDSIYPNDALPANRRYARPWTVRFLRDLARAHYSRFGTPLIVTSAARTVDFQRHLVRINGNAAPPTGDIASPHLYGQAIDLARRGMGLTEITWMRAYLTPIESEGKIDVEEEFQQSCFHISVYRRYLGAAAPKKSTPSQQGNTPTLLQAKSSAPAANSKKGRLPTALIATGLR